MILSELSTEIDEVANFLMTRRVKPSSRLGRVKVATQDSMKSLQDGATQQQLLVAVMRSLLVQELECMKI
jgi:hypothetical protein